MYDWIIEADIYRLNKQRAEAKTVSERASLGCLIAAKQKLLDSTRPTKRAQTKIDTGRTGRRASPKYNYDFIGAL